MIDWAEQPLRSLIFAPGNHPRKVAKVATLGADAIILDLEDAVAASEKVAARDAVRAALPTYRDTVVLARINGVATDLWEGDLEAVVSSALHGILVPKVESAAMLDRVDERVAELEHRAGLPRDTIRLFALIETARGVAHVEAIAEHAPPRLHTLLFGSADFTADLEIDLTSDATELLYARSRVVIAARAAGLPAPIDGVYLLGLRDEEGLVRDTKLARQLGFQGRLVIHPAQVAPVNRVFSAMSPAEIEQAQKIVHAFKAAEAAGSASIQVDGIFVDYPVYRRARRKLGTWQNTT
jgi:citrate lyase subunit beta/citryl-CoA lyase